MAFKFEEGGLFRGTVQFLDILLNNSCVENKHVKADADIDADKLEHQHRVVYSQESATTAADETKTVHVVKGTAGTIKSIQAGCVTANVGDSTVDVDLLVNGTSVLTAAIGLGSTQSAYELVEGAIDTNTLTQDDVVEIDIAVTAGTGTLGLGVFVYVDIFEDAD